jgi:hypothetical protein
VGAAGLQGRDDMDAGRTERDHRPQEGPAPGGMLVHAALRAKDTPAVSAPPRY